MVKTQFLVFFSMLFRFVSNGLFSNMYRLSQSTICNLHYPNFSVVFFSHFLISHIYIFHTFLTIYSDIDINKSIWMGLRCGGHRLPSWQRKAQLHHVRWRWFRGYKMGRALVLICDWVMVSNIFYFHPYLGRIPILTSIFFNWVETTN